MMYGSNMMGGSWGSSGGGGLDGILSTVTSLAILIGIILLVFWLIRQYSGAGIGRASTFAPGGETALDILKKRYARGEIDSNEYQEKSSMLSEG
ncbi:MAG: SHOCT domain-containing protein [Actinobacteria bacterium]|nr:SHOCT domain-containing protein [Actinomycetota bacterium]